MTSMSVAADLPVSPLIVSKVAPQGIQEAGSEKEEAEESPQKRSRFAQMAQSRKVCLCPCGHFFACTNDDFAFLELNFHRGHARSRSVSPGCRLGSIENESRDQQGVEKGK